MSRRKRSSNRRAGPVDAPTPAPSEIRSYPVWDRPTQLMHLGLLLLLPATLLSVQFAWIPVAVHLWAGYLLTALLLVRLAWGLIGSDSARFARFVAGPSAIRRYWPRLASRAPTRWPGHNPIGALYVIAILVLLLAACVSGLFVEGWGDWRGPLAERIPRALAVRLGDVHGLLQYPILVLVAVHVAVVVGYRWLKSENRIAAMFGSGRLPLETDPEFRFVAAGRALGLALLSGLLIVLLLKLGPIA